MGEGNGYAGISGKGREGNDSGTAEKSGEYFTRGRCGRAELKLVWSN